VASAAALSKGFAGYLASMAAVPETVAALGLLAVLGLVAVKGIKESARLAVVVTVIEVIGLLLVIGFGWEDILLANVPDMLRVDTAMGASWAAVLSGAFLAFYAFIGFEDMVNVVEEVKDPRRTMPLAIILSLAAAAVLYLLVVIVCLAVALPEELAGSSAPLNLVFERITTIDPRLISLIGLAATVNGVLVQIVMGSRILYGLSCQGWLPGRFAAVHGRYQTPVFATLAVVAAMAAGVLLLSLVSLASLTSFLVLTVFVLVNISLLVIKLRDRDDAAAVSVPVFVPALALLSCVGLLLFQILD